MSEDNNPLRQLRRLPPFGSFLGRVMEEHVAHMRALGYRYDTNEELLLRFDRFLQRHPELSGLPLNRLVEHSSEEQPSPSRLHDARRAGRIVSKAMHRLDPRVPILPIGEGVARAARQHHRTAHLYTDEEVRRILQAALGYPSAKAPWRPISLFTMLTLAYGAGLRGGEIVRLTLGDGHRAATESVRGSSPEDSKPTPVAVESCQTWLLSYLTSNEDASLSHSTPPPYQLALRSGHCQHDRQERHFGF